ncbi:hypothetical protein HMI54_001357 [Coelomomyces lativittatus]|nr:hypothetical protein HMI54_001357 [Coelomomyces lativittatus]KAJ1515545.1 hypothetical protein HMI56_003759 [Coelomomyces lativittatus]KAJ1517583.1 hypothetical protein HMI55_006619 [Coelomomyces lativittatus]
MTSSLMPVPTTTTLRSQKEAERKKFYTHTFDSPLKIECSNTVPKQLHHEMHTLLMKLISLKKKKKVTTYLFTKGLNQTQKKLTTWIQTNSSVVRDTLIVFLIRPNSLSVDLFTWIPSLVNFAKFYGPTLLVTLNSNQSWAKTSTMTLTISDETQDPLLKSILETASQFPQPNVPFYEKFGSTLRARRSQTWKPNFLPLNLKTLESSRSVPQRKRNIHGSEVCQKTKKKKQES